MTELAHLREGKVYRLLPRCDVLIALFLYGVP